MTDTRTKRVQMELMPWGGATTGHIREELRKCALPVWEIGGTPGSVLVVVDTPEITEEAANVNAYIEVVLAVPSSVLVGMKPYP